MATIPQRIAAAITAFNQPALVSKPFDVTTFGDWAARRYRYSQYYAMFESTVYQTTIHPWAQAYKTHYGLYEHVRSIYNPAGGVGAFHETHLLGGHLDPLAGDGIKVKSALPILIDDPRAKPDDTVKLTDKISMHPLRLAISHLWSVSSFATVKNILAMWGSVLGDVALKIVDDPDLKQVRIEIVHPAIIQSITRRTENPLSPITGYVIQEQRTITRKGNELSVTYTEQAVLDDVTGDVLYTTWINNEEITISKVDRLGFVPLVLIQHHSAGMSWGWSEFHPHGDLLREIDDQAAILDDYIRKMNNPIILFSGMTQNSTTVSIERPAGTEQNPLQARDTVPAIWSSNNDAKGTPLVADLDLASVLATLEHLIKTSERRLPELAVDMLAELARSGGEIASGRALRIARQGVITKFNNRRVNYDSAIALAHRMGITFLIRHNHDVVKGLGTINDDPFTSGLLEHRIEPERDVFDPDPLDKFEIETAMWSAIKMATEAKIPVVTALTRAGWNEQAIADMMSTDEWKQRTAAVAALQQITRGPGAQSGDSDGDSNSNDDE